MNHHKSAALRQNVFLGPRLFNMVQEKMTSSLLHLINGTSDPVHPSDSTLRKPEESSFRYFCRTTLFDILRKIMLLLGYYIILNIIYATANVIMLGNNGVANLISLQLTNPYNIITPRNIVLIACYNFFNITSFIVKIISVIYMLKRFIRFVKSIYAKTVYSVLSILFSVPCLFLFSFIYKNYVEVYIETDIQNSILETTYTWKNWSVLIGLLAIAQIYSVAELYNVAFFKKDKMSKSEFFFLLYLCASLLAFVVMALYAYKYMSWSVFSSFLKHTLDYKSKRVHLIMSYKIK
ncbi:hypothetical protein NEMIN01_0223 [Nematocida minor]|uniref:uncharacterized protein n=1 Tax=Nematocida minor TaxID=1912983 RepID=UPI002220D9B3|nr:uncharacterized protein NEMIN01_0119 [Nematocida minor]XP_051332125.1 uncharacterized protein NEMIN01_0223 [Nematocida minor]KAI5188855.1 hypothetical protein NEMIN01_0119 [Nematocida minor]KAI5188959.1 hypothetical protein NEMIN01_0223 [Nematocida minor]